MIVLLLALTIGTLYGAGVYLLLRRNSLKFILALGLLSNGTHLLIFTAGGLSRGRPPLIPEGAKALTGSYADPLPQALILTAIVISFGLTAFTVLLVHRLYHDVGTADPEELGGTDRTPGPATATIPPLSIPPPEGGPRRRPAPQGRARNQTSGGGRTPPASGTHPTAPEATR